MKVACNENKIKLKTGTAPQCVYVIPGYMSLKRVSPKGSRVMFWKSKRTTPLGIRKELQRCFNPGPSFTDGVEVIGDVASPA